MNIFLKGIICLFAVLVLTACVSRGEESTVSGQPAAECRQGEVEKRPCEKCGRQKRVCSDKGYWKEWSFCRGQGECRPGSTAQCCGEGQKTCNQDCSWGDCSSGECTPGETRKGGECGNCGELLMTCSEDCRWQEGECVEEGECTPGQEETRMGNGAKLKRTCSNNCEWSEWEKSWPKVDGYKGAKFGMSKREVKSQLSGKNFKEQGEPGDFDSVIYYKDSIFGEDCLVAFRFFQNKLCSVKVIFMINTMNDYKYISLFNETEKALMEKYGPPTERKRYRDDNPYTEETLELATGEAYRFDSWERGEGEIILGMGGDNFEIILAIEYNSIKLTKEQQEHADEKSKEDI